MASTLGGNKAVSVQERIKQLIEQGVPLTEATDQAHREAVAATELMFPTTEGDRPPPGVTTAATFGDGSTGTRAGLQNLLRELTSQASCKSRLSELMSQASCKLCLTALRG